MDPPQPATAHTSVVAERHHLTPLCPVLAMPELVLARRVSRVVPPLAVFWSGLLTHAVGSACRGDGSLRQGRRTGSSRVRPLLPLFERGVFVASIQPRERGAARLNLFNYSILIVYLFSDALLALKVRKDRRRFCTLHQYSER